MRSNAHSRAWCHDLVHFFADRPRRNSSAVFQVVGQGPACLFIYSPRRLSFSPGEFICLLLGRFAYLSDVVAIGHGRSA